MELLADENVETEWIQALRDDGHDLVRVVDVEELGVSVPMRTSWQLHPERTAFS
ncbi:hypothetical protein ACFQPA_04285 [Halomarina halobia]|uniref:hypothetical protein n=1 Tax=Halomarina halobia TaxID=3033386 RepID=UPI0023E798F9|nr:hypothetical protein [Halomarina sp. PSR21]